MKLTLILLMLGVSQISVAQKVESVADAQKKDRLKSVERGRSFKVNGEEYQHLPKVLAVQKKQSNKTEAQVLADVGSSEKDRIEDKGTFMVYKHGVGRSKASISSIASTDTYPTVLNTRTNDIGLLLGTIMVHPNNMADAKGIATSAGVELVKSYPHLNLVIYKAKKDADVLDAVAAISADKRVKDAYPEILEHVRVPH